MEHEKPKLASEGGTEIEALFALTRDPPTDVQKSRWLAVARARPAARVRKLHRLFLGRNLIVGVTLSALLFLFFLFPVWKSGEVETHEDVEEIAEMAWLDEPNEVLGLDSLDLD